MAKGFTFKQFHVDDDGCGMPVSTDGVLLGAWAELPLQGQIVDIGTGSGLLALMAAQRTAATPCTISAIELDTAAAKAARHNFAASPWSDRLHCIQQDIVQWMATQPAHCVDTIICNPPYFNAGLQADCQARATARHTDNLTHDVLLTVILHLLTAKGSASLILPEYEGRQLLQSAPEYGLHCQRLCIVKSTEKKPASRLLITLSPVKCARAISEEIDKEEQLCIHENGQYSSEFIALTRDFYLKL
ncbi:tRNA1(Val) (adenine(37)-N6)-methyltransferase [Photobacterium lipolyticum]|uniref:tRNA1(Val) (adenine(37)-N6)-methyltransferase n=1 Tax=Photobacterium lipolyticum TaxID=266810 RepID=A0A2T3MWA8_9GAMM|nr:methyltransferase [Photobacterium lipolyticum]PSW04221.1 SAM-dependent methyltransferase [Photobacterium lipolyticum]